MNVLISVFWSFPPGQRVHALGTFIQQRWNFPRTKTCRLVEHDTKAASRNAFTVRVVSRCWEKKNGVC